MVLTICVPLNVKNSLQLDYVIKQLNLGKIAVLLKAILYLEKIDPTKMKENLL